MLEPQYFMNAAVQEAMKAYDEGEVPVGCVIELNGKIVGRGYNKVESLKDASAHAEIIAISAASSNISDWRLENCTLYVTLEPCLMCLGAILQSRIKKIVFGGKDSRFGAIVSHFYQQEIERTYKYFPEIFQGLMEEQCLNLLKTFFEQLRKKN